MQQSFFARNYPVNILVEYIRVSILCKFVLVYESSNVISLRFLGPVIDLHAQIISNCKTSEHTNYIALW